MRDARQITDWAVEIGEARDLDPLLILAVIGTESSFKPTARSNAGAEGLMQVMTSVHEAKFDAFGGPEAAFDPYANMVVGTDIPVSYTHLRAHETDSYLVCRLLLEKKKKSTIFFIHNQNS